MALASRAVHGNALGLWLEAVEQVALLEDRPPQYRLVLFQGLVHRRVHLEQGAQVVGAAQGVDQRVGQRGRDARLALHLAAELDERWVVVGQARKAQVRRHEVQLLGPGVWGHLPGLEPEGRRGDLHRPRV